MADRVKAAGRDRRAAGEGVPILVHAGSGDRIARAREGVSVERDGRAGRIVDLQKPVVRRALLVLREEEGGR